MKKGFTIIETVMYIGILSMIFAILLPIFYLATTSSIENQLSLTEIEEESFVRTKINHFISSAQSIETPTAGQLSNFLKLTLIDSHGTKIEVRENGNFILLKQGSGEEEKINSGRVKVSDLRFIHNPSTHSSPDSVSYGFIINSYQVPTSTTEISHHE